LLGQLVQLLALYTVPTSAIHSVTDRQADGRHYVTLTLHFTYVKTAKITNKKLKQNRGDY